MEARGLLLLLSLEVLFTVGLSLGHPVKEGDTSDVLEMDVGVALALSPIFVDCFAVALSGDSADEEMAQRLAREDQDMPVLVSVNEDDDAKDADADPPTAPNDDDASSVCVALLGLEEFFIKKHLLILGKHTT